jgi:hypothetical protein
MARSELIDARVELFREQAFDRATLWPYLEDIERAMRHSVAT